MSRRDKADVAWALGQVPGNWLMGRGPHPMSGDTGVLTTEARVRLRGFYRAKLAEFEAALADAEASPVPSDANARRSRNIRIKRCIKKIAEMKRNLEGGDT